MIDSRRLSVRDRFYTSAQLGRTRSITPEGFLLCEGVAIARTGVQRYAASEILADPSDTGFIDVERTAEEVFRPETLASFEGKPITVEHPDEFVSPENHQRLAVGHVQNVRRGTGIEDDLVIADLLITAADAIRYVNESMPELSCGYDADYEQTEPGRAIQRNVVGNHVALVVRGRAGPRVSIKDGEMSMKNWKQRAWDRLLTAVKAKDAEAIRLEIIDAEKDPEGETSERSTDARLRDAETALKEMKDMLASLDSRMKSNDESEEERKEREAKEAKAKEGANDTIIGVEPGAHVDTGKSWTGDALREILSRAEILAPGIAIPTGDSLAKKDAVTALMIKALDEAAKTEPGREAIKPFLLGRETSKLTGDALVGVFNGAAELTRINNNRRSESSRLPTRDFGKPTSLADFAASVREASKRNFGV